MAVSGVAIWLRERRNNVILPANASWTRARTVILVGSENGSTMGFAAALHRELVAHGELVHTAPMSTVRYYPRAERLLVLTATYGEGQAPASAKTFLSRLARLDRAPAGCRRHAFLQPRQCDEAAGDRAVGAYGQ